MSSTSHSAPSRRSTHIPNARWWRVGGLLLISYLVAYIDRTNMSIAAPAMSKELGLDASQMGVLLSAFFWGYVVSLAFAGFVVTKLGAKRSMVAALIVFGLASAATGMTHDFTQLIIVRVILGLGEGLVFPAITIFLVKWFPSWERGRASGLSLLAIPISAIIMAPLGGWLIGNWDYRMMFIVQGLPPVVIAFVVLFLIKDDPTKDNRLSPEERDFILENRASGEKEQGGAWKDVYLNPRIWLISITYLLWLTGLYGFNQWLPTILTEASKQGIQAVGWLTTIPFVFAAVGMYVASQQSDKHDGRRTPFVAIPIVISGVALLAQHFIPGNLFLDIVFLSVACIGLHSAFGPWWPWALEGVPRNQTGYASSFILSVGNFGGIIGPVLVGVLTGGGAVSQGFYTLGYVLLASAVLAAVVVRIRRNHGARIEAPDTSAPVTN
ncbi:MFS transporter [Paenarthrobacter sp. NyZ202]|uniref:MFS transporter n=1 Tax=Paenarthrobacter sp. NyZ202 TaxID=3402689 RepID=UPI003CEB082A